jgi:NifU-like protein involved in Fe-S cluster formation
VQQARALGQTLLNFLQHETDAQEPEGIGDLIALSGVREHPSRRRCATLPWEALLHLLDDCA